VALGVLAIVLGLAFKGQNVAFMVGLAFAVAASANFPALLMSILWKRFTTYGAVASIYTGLTSGRDHDRALATVWVDIFHMAAPIVKYKNPGVFSLGGAFLVGILVSVLSREPAAETKFADEKLRAYVGIGAE
jgi:cation/acetate symporter